MAVNTRLLLKEVRKPKSVVLEREEDDPFYGRFKASPLERGFGYTLGGCFRRVLLSALPGCSITALKVDYVNRNGSSSLLSSEFENIDGMIEDTADFIQALKKVYVSLTDDADESILITKEIKLSKNQREYVLKAGDLQISPKIEIFNPEHVLAHFNEDAEISIEFQISRGRGYISSERNSEEIDTVGTIPIDSIFSPVLKVAHRVNKFRIGQRSDCDELILEIWTNGTITAGDALASAAKIIKFHMTSFLNFEDIEDVEESTSQSEQSPRNEILDRTLEDLELSVRSTNCLKIAGIRTIGELAARSSADLEKIKNLGSKSIEEVENKLKDLGIPLKAKEESTKKLRSPSS